MRTSFVKLMTLAICFFAFIGQSNAQYRAKIKTYSSSTSKMNINPAIVEMGDIQMIDKNTIKPSLKGGQVASKLTTVVTTIWNNEAALNEIVNILNDAEPGSYAMEVVEVNNGKRKTVTRGGHLALTDLQQLNRSSSKLSGNKVASKLTTVVTTIWNNEAALAKIRTVLEKTERGGYYLQPLSIKDSVSSGAARNVQMYNIKAIMR